MWTAIAAEAGPTGSWAIAITGVFRDRRTLPIASAGQAGAEWAENNIDSLSDRTASLLRFSAVQRVTKIGGYSGGSRSPSEGELGHENGGFTTMMARYNAAAMRGAGLPGEFADRCRAE